MAIPFGSIGQLALGNLVSRGADKLLNPNKTNINKFISFIKNAIITKIMKLRLF